MWIGLLHIRGCSRRYGIPRWRRQRWRRTRRSKMEGGRGGRRNAETWDATEGTRGWVNEGRTAMLRIGTKGWGCWLALRQLGGVRRGIEIANAHYGYFPIEGRIPLSHVSYHASRSFPSPSASHSLFPLPHLVFALSLELSFIPFAPYTHQFVFALSLSLSHRISPSFIVVFSLITSLLALVSFPATSFFLLLPLLQSHSSFHLPLSLSLSLPFSSENACWKAHTVTLTFPYPIPASNILVSYVDYFLSSFYCSSSRYIPLLVSSLSQFLTLIPFCFVLVLSLFHPVFLEYIPKYTGCILLTRITLQGTRGCIRFTSCEPWIPSSLCYLHHLHAIFNAFIHSHYAFSRTCQSLLTCV